MFTFGCPKPVGLRTPPQTHPALPAPRSSGVPEPARRHLAAARVSAELAAAGPAPRPSPGGRRGGGRGGSPRPVRCRVCVCMRVYMCVYIYACVGRGRGSPAAALPPGSPRPPGPAAAVPPPSAPGSRRPALAAGSAPVAAPPRTPRLSAAAAPTGRGDGARRGRARGWGICRSPGGADLGSEGPGVAGDGEEGGMGGVKAGCGFCSRCPSAASQRACGSREVGGWELAAC